MIILPCVPFLFSFTYLTRIFLLTFVFGCIFNLVFKKGK